MRVVRHRRALPPHSWVEEARKAQVKWAARPLRERLRVIRALRHRIAAEARELAGTAGTDRPESEVLSAEIVPLAEACRFLEREAP
ncbi:MAG TPA: hypothetical protein VG477_07845, partial [Thermoanaerobaculia bacterium]|nr:hypothetical protein [Thermoanaerobaculia bacterium]